MKDLLKKWVAEGVTSDGLGLGWRPMKVFHILLFTNVLGTFCKIMIKATSEESILNDQSLSFASKSNKKAPERQESRLICQNISR